MPVFLCSCVRQRGEPGQEPARAALPQQLVCVCGHFGSLFMQCVHSMICECLFKLSTQGSVVVLQGFYFFICAIKLHQMTVFLQSHSF